MEKISKAFQISQDSILKMNNALEAVKEGGYIKDPYTKHTNSVSINEEVFNESLNKIAANYVVLTLEEEEFINNLLIEDVEIKKHLKSQFISMLKNKKLTKKTDVDYDAVNGKIISIASFQEKTLPSPCQPSDCNFPATIAAIICGCFGTLS